ncbi:hypothetical protein THASP1DRAFT_25569, partial [Thamnocephalis sphaerospora]
RVRTQHTPAAVTTAVATSPSSGAATNDDEVIEEPATPSSDNVPRVVVVEEDAPIPRILSSKAIGKLPVGVSPLSIQAARSNASSPAATPTPTRSTFSPTEDWVSTWQPGLKLDTLIAVLDVVVPQVEALCASSSLASDQEVLTLLRSDELIQALPLPQVAPRGSDDSEAENNEGHDAVALVRPRRLSMSAPAQRPFKWSPSVSVWFRSLLWGHVYVIGRAPLGIWNGTAIQLFQVKSQQA